nr:MAG TPA: hypothetical protein [Caudoviricetes sp.]
MLFLYFHILQLQTQYTPPNKTIKEIHDKLKWISFCI